MSTDAFFESCGGVKMVRAGGDPTNPADTEWNFGVAPTNPASRMASGASFHEVFPSLKGKWDGKTTYNYHNACRKVLKKDLHAQYQPSGTCGGRAGSRGGDIVQCIMIAAGKRAKFHPVSHAWLYYLARAEYNMLNGGDGVASGSIPPMMAKYGLLTREECGDEDDNSKNSDDLATALGVTKRVPATWKKAASDNLATTLVRCYSVEEYADAVSTGGVGILSDSQGYTMTRDSDGCCRPQGVWQHYHCHPGIIVLPSGRKVIPYDQSWGDKTPSGPLLEGCPSNTFGVDWDVMDNCIKTGVMHVLIAFDPFEVEKDEIDMSFVF